MANITVTIPKSTTPEAPLLLIYESFLKVLVGGSAIFPDRCINQVGVRILDQGRQIVPGEMGTWMIGNEREVPWHYPATLEGPPYRLHIQGYNFDPVFPHAITFNLEFR